VTDANLQPRPGGPRERFRDSTLSILLAALALTLGCSDSNDSPTGPSGRIEALDIAYSAVEEGYVGPVAISQMILRYYGQDLRQCEIAGLIEETSDCCENPHCSGGGGGFRAIEAALRRREIHFTYKIGVVQFEDVKREIRAGRPVAVSFRDSFPGHCALIYGFRDDGLLLIHDPYLGTVTVPWAFDLGYAPNTRWVESLYEIAPN
jgi:hypothetical protein